MKKTFIVGCCLAICGIMQARGKLVGKKGTQICYEAPLQTNNCKFGWSAFLFSEEELGTSGEITEITFLTSYRESFHRPNQKIFMKLVPYSVFSSSEKPKVDQLTLVFEGAIHSEKEALVRLKLDKPFKLEGNQHLLIYCENHSGILIGSTVHFLGTIQVNQCLYARQNNNFPQGEGGIYPYRPSVWFTFKGQEKTHGGDVKLKVEK